MASAVTLTYRVEDGNGAFDEGTFTVTIEAAPTANQPPTAEAGDAQSVRVGGSVTLNASSSTDDGTIESYEWSVDTPALGTFGGNSATETVAFTANQPGMATVTLRVTDNDGVTNTDTVSIDIFPAVDAYTLDPPDTQNFTRGQDISVALRAVTTTSARTLTYALSGEIVTRLGLTLNENTRVLNGNFGVVDYTAGDATYTASDALGEVARVTFEIIPYDTPLLPASIPDAVTYTAGVRITPLTLPIATNGFPRLTYTLTGPGGGPLPAGLTFDGASRVLSGIPTTVASAVTLIYRVEDGNGAFDEDTFTVTIEAAPTAEAGDAQSVRVGGSVTLNASSSTDDGTIESYEWSVDTSALGTFDSTTTEEVVFTATQPGTATVTLRVTDNDGAMHTDTVSIDIFPAASAYTLSNPGTQNFTRGQVVSAALPAVTTLSTRAVTYALSGEIVTRLGLTLNENTRLLNGNFGVVDYTAGDATYTASDALGEVASVTFAITPYDTPLLPASIPDAVTYTASVGITPLTLPTGTTGRTGAPPRTYTLSGTIPTGLFFNAIDRVLSGIPATVASAVTLTYRLEDANGAFDESTFTVTIEAAAADNTAPTAIAGDDQNVRVAGSVTLNGTASDDTDGTIDTYQWLVDDSTLGTFDSTTISSVVFTANRPGTATVTLTVTDNDGITDTDTVSIDIFSAVSAYTLPNPGNQNFTRGQDITVTLPAVTTTSARPLTYALSGEIVTRLGLTLNENTRLLTGNFGDVAYTAGDATYTASDALGEVASVTFAITPYDTPLLPASIPDAVTYTASVGITPLTLPTGTTGRTGAPPQTYTLSGTIPTGLFFNAIDRVLSGIPATVASAVTLTYRLEDANGAFDESTFTVTIETAAADNTAPTAIAGDDQNVRVAGSVTLNGTASDDTDGTIDTYQWLVDDSTLGTFDSTTISSVVFTANRPGTATVTLTVTDNDGITDTDTVFIDIFPAVSAYTLPNPGNQNFTRGQDITVTLPAVTTTSARPLTYALSGEIVTRLGLTLNENTRLLNGNFGVVDYTAGDATYTASDALGEVARVTFEIIPYDTPEFMASIPDDVTYTARVGITPLTLPIATNGFPPLIYTLTGPGGGPLPAGLTFDGASRVLSGIPNTVASAVTLTYRVEDGNGAFDEDTFTVTIEAAPPANQPPPAEAGDAQSVRVGATVTLDGSGSADDDTIASYEWSVDTPALGTFDSTTTEEVVFTANQPGMATVTLRVTDNDGVTNTDTVSIDIFPAVGAYTLTPPDTRHFTRGQDISVALPAVTTLSARTLTYALSGEIVTRLGLTLNENTRLLNGNFGVVDYTAGDATYTASDALGEVARVTFEIIPYDTPEFMASIPDAVTYTARVGITPLTLPIATNGFPPLIYTLTGPGGGPLPAGLIFDGASRVLSGIPNTVASAVTLIYRVEDGNGAFDEDTFTVTIEAAPPANQPPTAEAGDAQSVRVGATVTLDGSGSADDDTIASYQWSVSPALGTFGGNSATETVAFTANQPGMATVTLRVTDNDGVTNTDTVSIDIFPAVGAYTLTPPDTRHFTRGQDISVALPAVTTLSARTLTYALSGEIVTRLGLTLNENTRVLNGNFGVVDYTAGDATYTASDALGEVARVTFEIIPYDTPEFMASIPDAVTYTARVGITPLTLPIATNGFPPLIYTLTGPGGGPLPAGLTFDGASRVLSGIPNTVASAVTLIYRVEDGNGAFDEDTFTVTIEAAPPANQPPTAEAGDAQSVRVGATVTLDGSGSADDDTIASYQWSVSPALGTFGGNSATETVAFTANQPGMATVTLRVTDNEGATDIDTVSIDIFPAVGAYTLDPPDTQNFTRGQDISVALPAVTTLSARTLTYALSGEIVTRLGLTLNGNTRLLNGNFGVVDYTAGDATYTASDALGEVARVTFEIIPYDTPEFMASIPDAVTYTAGVGITPLTLPIATNGFPPLIYTLTGPGGGPLPAGLTFDGASRVLSGIPTTVASAVTLIYRVEDGNGAFDEDTFTVTIEAAPTANQPPTAEAGDAQSVRVGATVTLDGSGSADDGTIESYEWSVDTSALGTFDSTTTEEVVFTATQPGMATVTLTVTDNDGVTNTDTVSIAHIPSGRRLYAGPPGHPELYAWSGHFCGPAGGYYHQRQNIDLRPERGDCDAIGFDLE